MTKNENRFFKFLYSNTGLAIFAVLVILLTAYTIRTVFFAQEQARQQRNLIPATLEK